MKARVLSTKKLLPNHRQLLLNADLAVLEADFITVYYKPFVITTINQNLIFTSQNAVKSFLKHEKAGDYLAYPVFCVGGKTKEAIERAGFKVTAFAEYAEELAEIIKRDHSGESFTFFSGNMRRDTLPDALANAGIAFNEIEVYETVLSPVNINATPDAVLFFSPSGVESYLKENVIGDAVCFCIGKTTASALEGINEKIVIANKPTVENVIVQCVNYYKNQN
ncbi:uroporphyrinogen-III synthase [Flavobacterium sp. MFBS3-15]|uniref:uroporphyrinogen-III synthase n=1 Tax=Flavobacterium sp. MFBS3-15 TaxID=2989816 RepID=UPI0022363D04|nr:uroporphyrinogen-III synthase [Flavobacterium sp. MFBS3-15]MCW4469222.1 uroporphyrinogen-III synthase [Flavobacterium sp. MFBS3-15]